MRKNNNMTSHEQLEALSPLECVLLPSEIANIAHVSRHHNYHVTFSVHLVHVACPPGVRWVPAALAAGLCSGSTDSGSYANGRSGI